MTNEQATDASPSVVLPCQFCGAWNRVLTSRARDRPKCGECGKPMLLDRPFPLSDETFERVIAEAGVPVLVDFYADWCGPCKMMAPEIDAFAARNAGEVFTAKLDTDRNQVTAQRFNIRGIPTLIRFAGGARTAEQSGAMRLADIERFAGIE
ncbi:MAG: thioredoxin [Gemmatimonadaceae bacterium]|nr:thioredoxin [Gemmatimonadaceae bacterium]